MISGKHISSRSITAVRLARRISNHNQYGRHGRPIAIAKRKTGKVSTASAATLANRLSDKLKINNSNSNSNNDQYYTRKDNETFNPTKKICFDSKLNLMNYDLNDIVKQVFHEGRQGQNMILESLSTTTLSSNHPATSPSTSSTTKVSNQQDRNIPASPEFYNTMQNVLLSTNMHKTQPEIYHRIMSCMDIVTPTPTDINTNTNTNTTSTKNDTATPGRNNNHQFHHHQHNKNYSFHSNTTLNNNGSMMMMNHSRAFSTSTPNEKEDKDKKVLSSSITDAAAVTTSNAAASTADTTNPSSTTITTTSSTAPPSTLKKDATMQEKITHMTNTTLSTIASFLSKIPGILWFYLTHPTEFKQKIIELKDAAKKEAHHYYMGSKLLLADVKTARQIFSRLLQGSTLTRRERKQFTRTVTDVFRIVPMSIFVLIPFMEFALPLALKLFPNMLPSTFQDSLKAEENMKRELKSRIVMAEFFQETLQDLVKSQRKTAANKREIIKENDGSSIEELESTETREETAASFLEFIEKARKGEFLPPEVIIKYSTFFKDELTLDNMPRMQLINMCKYMSIPPYGNDHLLRFQLRHKVRVLQEDDQRILWDGIDSLTKMELREACQERGMRSTGLSKEAYKRSLQQWIDLSVNRNVPISLLIMSRTFFLREEMTSRASLDTDGSKSVAGLADAISGLDKEVVNEVILESVTPDDKKHDPELMKLKLEVLEHQNELIEEEKEQRLAEETKRAEQALEKEEVQGDEKKAESTGIKEKPVPTVMKGKEVTSIEGLSTDKASSMKPEERKLDEESKISLEIKEEPQEKSEEESEKTLSSEEIDAISQLVSPDPVSAERQKLERIKAAMKEKEEEAEVPASQSEEVHGKDLSVEDIPAVTIEEIGKDSQVETFADEQDKMAAEQIKKMREKSRIEADSSTVFSTEEGVQKDKDRIVLQEKEEKGEKEYTNKKLDVAIERLASKVESMVGNLEIQLSDVEEKIGNKLHFLDKDMDGILSREEMALCLQSVLKRPLTLDEAMAIAADMDENEDGYFSMDELSKWLETNRLVRLVEEGRDAEVDNIIAQQASKLEDKQSEKEKTREDQPKNQE